MKRRFICALLFLSLIVCMYAVVSYSTPVSTTHYISFTNISSQMAYLDMRLPFETYSMGGPFTVTMETRHEKVSAWINPLTNEATRNPGIVTCLEGDIYGFTEKQSPDFNSGASTGRLNLMGKGWQQVSFIFQNVGAMTVAGNYVPGNMLRTYFLQTVGTVYIRNLQIKDASGAVVYDMNTDPDLLELTSRMQANGMTELDIANLEYINEAHMWQIPASLGMPGDHYASVHIGSSEIPTTSRGCIGLPTTTTPGCIGIPTTSSTTHVYKDYTCVFIGHEYINGYCRYCGGKNPNLGSTTVSTNISTTISTALTTQKPNSTTTERLSIGCPPCAFGHHNYVNGVCSLCSTVDPDFKPTTKSSASADTDLDDNGRNGFFSDPIVYIIIGTSILAVACVAMLVIKKFKKAN